MSDLHIPSGPQRIVCLTEEPTEILYTLGEGHRVVGISAYTLRPPEARRDKPMVSAFVGGSVEMITKLQPDLVIGFSDIQADLASKLIAANMQVLIFNQRSLQEILGVIVDIGSLVGARERAQKRVADYVFGLQRAAERAERLPVRPRVYFEEWDEPMICGIAWVSELIEIAGGVDIFRERATGKLARERFVDAAQVARGEPDLMLASWCGKTFDPAAVRARPEFAHTPAIVHDRVREIPAEIILQPGPACLTDGLERLEAEIRAAADDIVAKR